MFEIFILNPHSEEDFKCQVYTGKILKIHVIVL